MRKDAQGIDFWIPSEYTVVRFETRDELGLYTFEAALSTPVSLADVQAIEIAGQEISFAD